MVSRRKYIKLQMFWMGRLKWLYMIRSGFYLLIFVTILNLSGFLDHLVEISFSQFKWPPFIDVRTQVDLINSGKGSEYLYYNDWNFNPSLVPWTPVCNDNLSYLRIMVKSKVDHFSLRQSIRQYWGRNRTVTINSKAFTVKRAIFVLGQTDDITLNWAVRDEYSKYGDILQGNFIDAYYNNTKKIITALDWLRVTYCPDFEFVLFVDDDYHVSIPNLLLELSQLKSQTSQLYMGFRFNSGPFRIRLHKHYIPLSIYPYDSYPPYISAGAILLSQQTARDFYLGSQFVKYFPFDDIYFGIVAKLLKNEPKHNEKFKFWEEKYKKVKFKDVIAAHGFSNVDLMEKAFLDSENSYKCIFLHITTSCD